jgi:hypothetical protein
MSISELAISASLWTSGGTLLAILLNQGLGDPADMLAASLVGALLGSSAGWMLVLNRLPHRLTRRS